MSVRMYTSTIGDGPMRLYDTRGNIHADGMARLKIFLMKVQMEHAAAAHQVHGTHIEVVREVPQGVQMYDATDAFVTNIPGVALCMRTADCVPVFFWSRGVPALGIAHCGRKGVAAGLAPLVVRKLCAEYGCVPRELSVHIGPCIRQRHYQVDGEVADEMRNLAPQHMERDALDSGKELLDMPGWITEQLVGAGVAADEITDGHEDTYAQAEKYYSYRRYMQGDGDEGWMVSVIVLG